MRRKTQQKNLGHAASLVLQAIAGNIRYGFDIMDVTGLPSGTVYPALSSLEERGFVRSTWESAAVAHSEKRPPRRYYEITPDGRRILEATLDRLRLLEELRRHRLSDETGRA